MEMHIDKLELLKAIKEMTARSEASRKADRREMLEKIDANMKSLQEDIKAAREQRKAEKEADLEGRKQEITAGQERLKEEMKAQMASLVSRIEDNNEKFEVLRDILISQMDALQERIMACLGKTEATDLKANPEEMQSKAEHQDVPKEQVVVKPVGGLKKRHRGRNLVAERRWKPKERTRVNCEAWRKLAAASMKWPTVRKWHGARETSGKIRPEMRPDEELRKDGRLEEGISQKCNCGIRNKGLRQRLQSKSKFAKIYRKTIGLEIARQIARPSVRLRTLKDWTLWSGRPPPKQKKRPHTE
jgi:hypothetical protein